MAALQVLIGVSERGSGNVAPYTVHRQETWGQLMLVRLAPGDEFGSPALGVQYIGPTATTVALSSVYTPALDGWEAAACVGTRTTFVTVFVPLPDNEDASAAGAALTTLTVGGRAHDMRGSFVVLGEAGHPVQSVEVRLPPPEASQSSSRKRRRCANDGEAQCVYPCCMGTDTDEDE